MFNPEYNTERDKAFTIRCFYPDMRFGGPNITEIRKLNENKDKLIPFKDDVSLSAEKLAYVTTIVILICTVQQMDYFHYFFVTFTFLTQYVTYSLYIWLL